LRAVYHSGEGPGGVVYDLLVAERSRSGAIGRDQRLGILWNLFDQCIREKRLDDEKVMERITRRYGFHKDLYQTAVAGIRFFEAEARSNFFLGSSAESLGAVIARVAGAWQLAGRYPADGPEFVRWQSVLGDVAQPLPYWVTEGDPKRLTPLPVSPQQPASLEPGKSSRGAVVDSPSSDAAGFVFISYCHFDQAFVDDLARKLRAEGVAVWYDPDLAAGQRWVQILAERISEASAMIVVVSPESARSAFVEKEILFAQDLGKRLLPVLVRDTANLLLQGYQRVDARNGLNPVPGLIAALGLTR
jgi:hypothetical protein